MKKTFFLVVCIALTAMALATPVSRDKAEKAANHFWHNVLLMNSSVTLDTTTEGSGIYLFTSTNGGFVIVAADDAARPILGYSTKGVQAPVERAELMPTALSHWLKSYCDEINYARSANLQRDAEWDRLYDMRADRKDSIDAVGPLMSTTWYQVSPYNDSCPSGAMTGCVATATAQIMKFWNFPPFGEGYHAFNAASSYGVQYADFGHSRYDWANMPDVLRPSSAAEEKAAVAKLMYHFGVGIDMGYGPTASGAIVASYNDPDARCAENALWKHFHYDRDDLHYTYKGSMSNNDWTDTLVEELRTYRRPILYSAMSSGGGHTFVCDGYDSWRYLHFNFGEGGAGDGFYAIGAINAGGLNFNSDNNALMGIHPSHSIFINETRIGFTREGGSKEIWLSPCDTCGDPCTATPSDSWLSIDTTGFNASSAIAILCDENNSGQSRTGTIVFRQGEHATTLSVTQLDYGLSDFCQLTVQMGDSHNEAWADDACLTFESLDGYVFGRAAHLANSASSVKTVDIAPHDVKLVWHSGGPKDRHISYKVLNLYGETLADVSNAYYNATDLLFSWPCTYVGIDQDASDNESLTISPNPATDVLTISGLEPQTTVSIVDLNGRILMQQRNDDNISLTLDVASLDKGIYLLRILNSSNTIKKIVIR